MPQPMPHAALTKASQGFAPRLAGRLGRAMLTRVIDQGWATRQKDSRILQFTASGEQAFNSLFEAA